MKHFSKKLAAPIIVAGLATIGLSACNQATDNTAPEAAQPSYPQVNENNIKAHIAFLADDTLEGRDTGSNGYQIAANYVTSYFKQYGLTPMGEHGGFEQQVTFRKAQLVDSSATMTINAPSGEHAVAFKEQFLTSGSALTTDSAITADTVFVGYGVVDKAFGLDDYAGLDVKGKVVVMLTGRPESLPSEEGAHIGSSREKARHAAERGAVGIVTIHTPKREKVRKFSVSAKYAATPSYSWLDKNSQPFGKYPELKGSAYIDRDAALPLFEGAEMSLEQIFAADSENQPVKGFALNAGVTLTKQSTQAEITSPNVVAAIEGSDPALKNEYVVFSAHLDHIGVRAHSGHGDEGQDSEEQDTINNGALDNASGVSILLETARMIASMDTKPQRSILFVVVTGEEKGLLGSSYFANNPTVPAMQMVANVNLDMPLILYPFADVIAFGSTHSTLGGIVESAAGKVNVSLSPDPLPEQALFTRSDHYSFVKAGIPSVFLMTGFKSKDPEIDGGKMFMEFLSTHYHNHSDEIELPIRYDAAASFAEVNMMIGIEIANQAERPKWHDGDFFGNTFAQ
ncbi:M28 family metallopeptidase [Thalassotalea montiporae]